MKGILGRKLGMTQVFDDETGVVTPVTVIEAGPCPVVQVKTGETDGYDAVQLAFDEVSEKRLTKGELGHLSKADVAPHRKLVEFRGPSELQVGETVTVEAFQPGDPVKVTGVSVGKGFAGTIKRHNFKRGPKSHGSHNIRKPGSVGASAFPSRVFRGMRMAGRMGGKRRTQVGLVVHEIDVERNLLLSKERFRARETASSRSGRRRPIPATTATTKAPKAPLVGADGSQAKQLPLDASVFAVPVRPHLVHEAVRAELAAARAGTRGAKSRGLVAGGRSRPWRQKGTGRARAGTIRAPQWTGGGMAFPPSMRDHSFKVNRKARRAAFRMALSAHATEGTLAVFDAGAFAEPSTKSAARFLDGFGKELPLVVVLTDEEEGAIKSFRNLQRVAVTAPEELDVGAVVWARSLLISEKSLPIVEARAGKAENGEVRA